MPLTLVTPPTGYPITWAQVQKQLRLEGLEDDADFVSTVIIPAAVDRAEAETRRALLPQTWQFVLDGFGLDNFIEIPKPPLVAGSVVITYIDTQGVTQTWSPSSYLVQAPSGPRCRRGRVALPFASVWPVTQGRMGAVTIQFQCGYADAAHIPSLLISGMLMDCGAIYEYREAVVVDSRAVAVEIPRATQSIYQKYRSLPRQRVRQVVEGVY